MYLLFSFVLCKKMRKKIHKKFHKSTLLPDWSRWRHQSAFIDGHNYTNAYGTTSFSPEGRENFIL